MNFIIMLIVGGIAGWLASMLMKTDGQQGIFLNIVVGIIGGLLGGFLLPMVGLSFGGWIGYLITALIGAVVLLGGPAKNFRETMRYQWRYTIEHDSTIAPEDRAAALARAMRQQELNVAASTEAWRRSIQDLDPLIAARQLRMPVLILQGLTDRAVSPEDANSLNRAIRESGNTHVDMHLFPGINHHFQLDAVGATNAYDRLPSQALAPVVLDAMCEWFRKTWKIETP